MTSLESIEKLRTISRNMAKSLNLKNHEECNLLLITADEIEREIAERYMELPEGWTAEKAIEVLDLWPRWDDGSPCMFGDEFTCYPKYDMKKKYEVFERLTIYWENHVWNRGEVTERPHDGGFYEWNYMRPGGDGGEEIRRRIAEQVDKHIGDLSAYTVYHYDYDTGKPMNEGARIVEAAIAANREMIEGRVRELLDDVPAKSLRSEIADTVERFTDEWLRGDA